MFDVDILRDSSAEELVRIGLEYRVKHSVPEAGLIVALAERLDYKTLALDSVYKDDVANNYMRFKRNEMAQIIKALKDHIITFEDWLAAVPDNGPNAPGEAPDES